MDYSPVPASPDFSIRTLLLAAVAFLLLASAAHASIGGCDEQYFQSGFYLEDNKRVFDDEKFQAFTTRLDTPVFASSTGTDRTKTVGFSEKLLVKDPGEGSGRVLVRTLADQEIGWIERDDLLCRLYPLADDKSGLLRRVVVQTETAVQGEVTPRTAYHSSGGQCEGGNQSCPKLSRFQWYFVYMEQGGHILLSESANLGGPNATLVGWLPEADGIRWNTAVALRPSEELENKKAPDGKTEAHVCSYPTIDSMNDAKACRPILGGLRWFKIDTRLPIIRDLGDTYEVAISSAATSGTFEEALSLTRLDALKSVDVFFVIDGTKSMQNVIDTIKGRPGFPGVVDQIRTRIKGKIRQGGTVRYGFRIYRDTGGGAKSATEEEGLALGEDCASNEEAFTRSFASVRAFDPGSDPDYSENLFGGLIQASRDFASCPDHLKLVVVIGDAGYDPNAQRARGQPVYDLDAVAERYVRGRRLNTQPVVIFIRTPDNSAEAKLPDAYSSAYKAFSEQGEAILKRVYGAMQATGVAEKVDPSQFFFQLSSDDANYAVVDNIITRVDTLLQPDVVNKLATRLNAGESLVDAITAMQGSDKVNVPVLYWNVIADSLCKRLGSQCTQSVLEGVFRAYIKHGDDLTTDILLSERQLNDWRELLGKFKTFWSQLRSGERSRGQLVNVLMESVGSVLKLDIDDSGKSIGEFAQLIGGLPFGAESKLMAYSPAELRNEDLVQQCEIQHLINYAGKKSDVIQIAFDGDKLAVFTQEQLPQSACPSLTPKGKAVPHVVGAPRPRALNATDANTDYNLSFRKGNERYFWVPMGYLP
jgi:hypothetical protein